MSISPTTPSPAAASASTEDQIVRFLGGLWRLNRRIKADIVPLVEPLGLDLRLYFIMLSIRKGARHPSVIAQRLDFPASLLSRYLETLRKLGYTERQPDPADSRRVLLNLSPAGDQALNEVMASIRQRTGERLEGLDPARLSALLDALELLASLDSDHSDPTSSPTTPTPEPEKETP